MGPHTFSEIHALIQEIMQFRNDVLKSRDSTFINEFTENEFIKAILEHDFKTAFSLGMDLEVDIDTLYLDDTHLMIKVIDSGDDLMAAILMELGGHFVYSDGTNIVVHALDAGMLGLVIRWVLSVPHLMELHEITSHPLFNLGNMSLGVGIS